MAIPRTAAGSLLPLLQEGMPDARGWLPRRIAMGVIVLFLLLLPLPLDSARASWIWIGTTYVMVGISVNILMGYLGQISLGHQAFVGVGAFTSAYAVAKMDMPFLLGITLAAVTGALAAAALGFIALRLTGLYLALVTLAYGEVAEKVIFNLKAISGGGGGARAPRPQGFTCVSEGGVFNPELFTCEKSYVYLCYAFLALLLFIDWKFVRSKAGRAVLAIRENEIAAASFGINVVGYKLLAFVLSGAFAGVAGALFAHGKNTLTASVFDFRLALTFVLMTAVGGLGSRAGIFLISMFFAIFPLAFNQYAIEVLIVGPLLLLLTLALAPGGMGQQIKPIVDWLNGKPFTFKHDSGGVATGGGGVRP